MSEIFKLTALELAKHHKKYCNKQDCAIPLNILRIMAEKCGVVFTDLEKENFI